MTMQCARCHDHKFDPIPSRDYYSLLAFFDKIPEWGMAIRQASHPFVYAPTADQRRQLAQLDESVATSKQSLALKEEDIVAEQKRWEATLKSFDNTRTVPFDSERVRRGLTHQFLNDLPFTMDGSTTKDLGKVVNKRENLAGPFRSGSRRPVRMMPRYSRTSTNPRALMADSWQTSLAASFACGTSVAG
jgi:hypothetical protein